MSPTGVPRGPDYAGRSLAGVFTSGAAALGAPGFVNTLGFPVARRVCVVMVDGLGRALLKRYGGHAPYLRSVLDRDATTVEVAFPTTTAASLATLGTGMPPGAHGLVGYDVLDPDRNVVINQLGGWDEATDPLSWQPHQTVFERLAGTGVEPVTVSLPRFGDSALTRAALRGSRFVGARTLHARFQRARDEVAAAPGPILLYLYLNELDKAGHQHGIGSPDWLHALEETDGSARRLAGRLPADTLLVMVGDHGMVDVPEAGRIDFSEQPELLEGIEHTAGEPRFVQLHFRPEVSQVDRERTRQAWVRAYGAQAWVLSRDEAIAAGWFGAVDDRVRERIGELMVTAHEQLALYDGRRTSPAAFEMVGHHGSPTRAEREVPLLVLNRPGSESAARPRRG